MAGIDECLKQLLEFNDQLRQQQASLMGLQNEMNVLMVRVRASMGDRPQNPPQPRSSSDNTLANTTGPRPPAHHSSQFNMIRNQSMLPTLGEAIPLDEAVERAISVQFEQQAAQRHSRDGSTSPSLGGALLKSLSGVSFKNIYGMLRNKTQDRFASQHLRKPITEHGDDKSFVSGSDGNAVGGTRNIFSSRPKLGVSADGRRSGSIVNVGGPFSGRRASDGQPTRPGFWLMGREKEIEESKESVGNSSGGDEEDELGDSEILVADKDDLEAQTELTAPRPVSSSSKKGSIAILGPATTSAPPPPPVKSPAPAAWVDPLQRHGALVKLYIRYFAVPQYNEFRATLPPTEFNVILGQVLKYNPYLLIHPRSSFKAFWDFIMTLLYIVALLAIPISVGFRKARMNLQPFSITFTFFFIFDSLINMLTLLFREGEPMHPRRSISHYMHTRFFLDLLTGFPIDLIFYQTNLRHKEPFLLLRLPRISRLLGIIGANPYYAAVGGWFQSLFGVGASFTSVWLFGALLIVYLHFYACGVFFMGELTGYASWKERPDLLTILEAPPSRQYTWAIFSAIGNTFPITGFRPGTAVEQWATVICCLIGALIYASLVGTISSFSFGLDSSGRMYKQKMDEVNEYMTYKNLSSSLKKKVRNYFELKYRGKYFNEVAILKELNDSLRQEITIHNSRDLIAKVNFLSRNVGDGRDSEFLGRIASALKACYYITGDTIFEQGRVGNEMYFIHTGTVEIIVAGNRVAALSDGAFFGEVALLGQVPRTATIRAAADTVAYRLDRSDFEAILADFDDMAVRIRLVYEERMQKVRKEKEMVAAKPEDEKKEVVSPPPAPPVVGTAEADPEEDV